MNGFACVKTLELFIGKFSLNEHAQDYSSPVATSTLCSNVEKLTRQVELSGVVKRVTHLSKLPRVNEQFL